MHYIAILYDVIFASKTPFTRFFCTVFTVELDKVLVSDNFCSDKAFFKVGVITAVLLVRLHRLKLSKLVLLLRQQWNKFEDLKAYPARINGSILVLQCLNLVKTRLFSSSSSSAISDSIAAHTGTTNSALFFSAISRTRSKYGLFSKPSSFTFAIYIVGFNVKKL